MFITDVQGVSLPNNTRVEGQTFPSTCYQGANLFFDGCTGKAVQVIQNVELNKSTIEDIKSLFGSVKAIACEKLGTIQACKKVDIVESKVGSIVSDEVQAVDSSVELIVVKQGARVILKSSVVDQLTFLDKQLSYWREPQMEARLDTLELEGATELRSIYVSGSVPQNVRVEQSLLRSINSIFYSTVFTGQLVLRNMEYPECVFFGQSVVANQVKIAGIIARINVTIRESAIASITCSGGSITSILCTKQRSIQALHNNVTLIDGDQVALVRAGRHVNVVRSCVESVIAFGNVYLEASKVQTVETGSLRVVVDGSSVDKITCEKGLSAKNPVVELKNGAQVRELIFTHKGRIICDVSSSVQRVQGMYLMTTPVPTSTASIRSKIIRKKAS